MCRATRTCSELGNKSEEWSSESPLPPPKWIFDQLEKFVEAVRVAAAGDAGRSRVLLGDVRGGPLREWYLDHGQNSGTYRNRHFRVARPSLLCVHSGSPPSSMISAAYKRDGYRCRYCGLGVIPVQALTAYECAVGSASFHATNKNDSHGAALVFRATYDHVDPLSCGGLHNLDNLVTACYSCNFGKAGFTVAQLGLSDPRLRPPIPAVGWDGLVSSIPHLRRMCTATSGS